MKKNIGKTDRVIRLIAGFIIIVIGLYFKSWWGAIGLIPVFTALTGWCGLYAILGMDTCSIKGK